jgi:hypothetical protein
MAKFANGYGHYPEQGKTTAHRVYYERVYGPVPNGLALDHLCRQKACVNPSHLEAVSQYENVYRGKRPSLTPEQVQRIRDLHKSTKLSQAKLGALFDVSRPVIWRLLKGKTYRHVP